MKKISGVVILALFLFVTMVGCTGGSSSDSAPAATAALSTVCGPRFNLTTGLACPDNLCKSGLIVGTADDRVVGSYSFQNTDAMCTKACNTNSDCTGISFATTNRMIVTSETWACVTSGTGKYCAVSVVAPAGSGNSCSGCGGVFCSGHCIGCPQCATEFIQYTDLFNSQLVPQDAAR